MNKVENSERANNALRLKQMEQFFGELFDIAICRCRDCAAATARESTEFQKPKNAFSETKGVHGACSLHVAMMVQGWALPILPPRPAADHCSLLNRPQTRREQKWQHLIVTVFAVGAGSSTADDLDWQPNDSATGEADMQTPTPHSHRTDSASQTGE